ncbi:hypothetical protein BH11MYX1_BH11MYX1_05380 [soil metagenome]
MMRVLAFVLFLGVGAVQAAPLSTTDFSAAVGALVNQVDEPVGLIAIARSPLLGLEKGDLVIAINGEPAFSRDYVGSGMHLDRTIQTLTVLRGKKELALTIHLKLDAATEHLDLDRFTEMSDRNKQIGAQGYVPVTKNGAPSGVLVKQPIYFASVWPQEGDLIRKIDGRIVTTSADVASAYESARAKPQFVIELERSGAPFSITVILDRADPAIVAAIASIKKINDTTYEVPKTLLDSVLANPMAVMKGARVVPAVKDGKPSGFKLYAIRPGSLFEMLGLQNGDTLHAVNDNELTTAEQALDAYEALRGAKKWKIMIERRGAKMTLTYTIK